MPNPTPPALHIGHLTDRGQRREVNEDHYWIPTPEIDPAALARKGMLFLVADGMGGHQGGQRASQLAASIVPQVYYGGAGADVAQSMRQALQAANDEIVREARANAALHNMGTTAVAAVIQGNRLTIAHVGDSRAYRLRSGQLSQLTSDHSFVEEGISRGQITLEDAVTHPYRGVITRALGAKPELQPDVRELDWLPGDQLLLCTDGLSNMASPEEMAGILSGHSPQQAVRRLVDLANQHGGPDNITAIVLSYGGAAAGGKESMPLLLGGLAVMVVALLAAAVIFWPSTPPPETVAAVTPGAEVITTEQASQSADTAVGDAPAATASQIAAQAVEVTASTATVTGTPAAEEPTATVAPFTPPATPTSLLTPPTAPPLVATVLPVVSPTTPQLQAPNDGDTMVEEVEFRWVSVANAAGYRVETRSDRPGQTEWRVWADLPASQRSFSLTFVNDPGYFAVPGTVYYWRVAALDAAGRPTYSAERRFVMQRAQAATPTPRPTDTPTQQPPTPQPPTEEPPTPQPPTEEPPPIQPTATSTSSLSSAVVFPGDMSGLTESVLQPGETPPLSDLQRAIPSTQSLVFLPLVGLASGIPSAPILDAIENPDGFGAYDVQWSAVINATYYLLEEAHDLSFSGASEVYSGIQQSYAVSDRGAARYYYRVRAGNTDWQTPWSEAQYTDVLWEREPNNLFTQANGPLVSGLTYRGQFDPGTDLNDYYRFDLAATHDIEVWLTNIAPGENYDLILRNDAGQIPGGYSGQLGNADEYVHLIQQPAGRYYARVFNRSSTVSQQPYQLRVVYE